MLVGITITYGEDTLPESAMASEQLFASKAYNWVDIDSRLSKCVALSEFCVDIRARMIDTQDIKSIAYIMERACYLKSKVKLRCLGESDSGRWVTYEEFKEDRKLLSCTNSTVCSKGFSADTDSMDTSHVSTPCKMTQTSFPADAFPEIDIADSYISFTSESIIHRMLLHIPVAANCHTIDSQADRLHLLAVCFALHATSSYNLSYILSNSYIRFTVFDADFPGPVYTA